MDFLLVRIVLHWLNAVSIVVLIAHIAVYDLAAITQRPRRRALIIYVKTRDNNIWSTFQWWRKENPVKCITLLLRSNEDRACLGVSPDACNYSATETVCSTRNRTAFVWTTGFFFSLEVFRIFRSHPFFLFFTVLVFALISRVIRARAF